MCIKTLKVQVLGYGRQVAKPQLVQFESLCHARYSLDHGAPVRMNPGLYHEISEEDSALPPAGRENGIIGSPEPGPNALEANPRSQSEVRKGSALFVAEEKQGQTCSSIAKLVGDIEDRTMKGRTMHLREDFPPSALPSA
jgi:hypothetical protein